MDIKTSLSTIYLSEIFSNIYVEFLTQNFLKNTYIYDKILLCYNSLIKNMHIRWLNSDIISQEIGKYWYNLLPEPPHVPLYKKILKQFQDYMVYILIIAAVIAIFYGEYIDGIIILIVVLINALIWFIQEYRADQALAALKSMLSSHSTVIRDGKKQRVESRELVPWDILYIEAGIKVPADGKMIESNSVKISEAALTGESVPVTKENDSEIFMGTQVAYGTWYAQISETGGATRFWQIAYETNKTEKKLSPLAKELQHISFFVGKLAILISAVLLLVEMFVYGKSFGEAILFSISVAVAAVPEWLLATMTISLALSVRKLAKQKAIIRKLSSVETLWGVTVICSDKTWTLTKNQMTITQIYVGEEALLVSGAGYNLEWKVFWEIPQIIKDELLLVSSLCINASLEWKKVIGDPTEAAFIPLVYKLLGQDSEKTLEKMQDNYARIKEFPFDNTRKMMSVVCDVDGIKKILSKGALLSILENSTHFYNRDWNIEKFTQEEKQKVIDQANSFSEKALRVLALASRDVDIQDIKEEKDIEHSLVFIWLVWEIDPPRDGLLQNITITQQAGIKTIVITWDAPKTALAIASQIGIIQDAKTASVFIWEIIEKMDDAEFQELLNFKKHKREILFARVAPIQKKRIVQALQANGEIVAVTGDGVNDAPALKEWDIGIAMGITGTDVSKESADVILADDSFWTIVTAIVEWRVIYANFRKFIFYLFSSNIAELTLIFLAMLFHLPLPLTAAMILIINLGTDVIPALGLWVDPAEENVINKKPRDTKEKIMNSGFIKVFSLWWIVMWIFVFGLYYYFLKTGSLWIAQTVAFSAIVVIQILNSFMLRSFDISLFNRNRSINWLLIFGWVFGIWLLFLFTNTPFFQEYLRMSALDWQSWWIIVLSCSILVIIADFIKVRMKFR